MSTDNNTVRLKRKVLAEIIKTYLSGNDKDFDKIPFKIRPRGSKVPYRCCTYKERAILRQRVIAGLGHPIEDDDEIKDLNDYAKEAIERTEPQKEVLTISDIGCQGCVPSRIYVTDLCQGCVARPCLNTCKFDAIKVENGRAIIDKDKCVNCMQCVSACPYNAIAKIRVPCEEPCPVDAIKKNAQGYAEIDFDKCISCGACVSACPFGAVTTKSQIIDILKAMKQGKKVVAMLAPSIAGQYDQEIEKTATGLIKAGFSKIYEVAYGADITATNEAKDFEERIIEKGDKFMTTSCCAAYNELIEKQLDEIKPFVSNTKTPLYYTAEIARQEDKDAVTVFVTPCVAKRKECLKDPNIDYVLSVGEVQTLFFALDIDVNKCEDYQFNKKSSTQGRNFAITGGVAQSVKIASGNNPKLKSTCINGLNKKAIQDLKSYAKKGECPLGNIVEVMACPGGCVGGSSTQKDARKATRQIKNYAQKSDDLK